MVSVTPWSVGATMSRQHEIVYGGGHKGTEILVCGFCGGELQEYDDDIAICECGIDAIHIEGQDSDV